MANTFMKFDTLAWAKELEKSGIPPQQAEAQVALIFRIVDDNVCTKQDLRDSEGRVEIRLKELDFKIEEVKREVAEIKKETVEIRKEIAEVKKELMIEIEKVKKELTIEIEKIKEQIEKIKEQIEKTKEALSDKLSRWIFCTVTAQTAIILAVVKLMH